MPQFLLEIGCEELPAAACVEAALQLPGLAREHLGAEPRSLYIGPRRLAFPGHSRAAIREWRRGRRRRI